MKRWIVAATVTAVAALFCCAAPPARAMPNMPFCPGDGQDTQVMGADKGYCDFMFMPDGSYVHCEWGGFQFGNMMTVAEQDTCWRVNKNGTPAPKPAPIVEPTPPDRPNSGTDQ